MLSDLYSKKRRYKNLKTETKELINYLEKSLVSIRESIEEMNNECYSINEEKVGVKNLLAIKDKLQNQQRILKNSIYPSIKEKINNIEDEIVKEENV